MQRVGEIYTEAYLSETIATAAQPTKRNPCGNLEMLVSSDRDLQPAFVANSQLSSVEKRESIRH